MAISNSCFTMIVPTVRRAASCKRYPAPDNYCLVTVRPLVWNGFKGIGKEMAIVQFARPLRTVRTKLIVSIRSTLPFLRLGNQAPLMSKQNDLNSGGLGYVGGRIARYLAADRGSSLRLTSRRASTTNPSWLTNGEIAQWDITADPDDIRAGVEYRRASGGIE